jgi:hypothetical protein
LIFFSPTVLICALVLIVMSPATVLWRELQFSRDTQSRPQQQLDKYFYKIVGIQKSHWNGSCLAMTEFRHTLSEPERQKAQPLVESHEVGSVMLEQPSVGNGAQPKIEGGSFCACAGSTHCEGTAWQMHQLQFDEMQLSGSLLVLQTTGSPNTMGATSMTANNKTANRLRMID